MYTKQLCVFIENRKGRLAEVTRLLAEHKINIRAMSLADMPDLGVLRLIVDDRVRCLQALRDHGFAVQEADVIAVEIQDEPGGLHRIIEVFDRDNVNIEYMYTFFRKNVDTAIVVLKIDNAAQAAETMRKNAISILPEDAIQNL
ncbi:MAG TPA: ACT domain-containing protein [Phycisphaerae bacterium]|nr:ACT domain-containing protein [Phycisphaerae bacterium]HRY71381.1 ACT domain-containing protein [Phycisphaerae bacterium]HSA29857.1 ACT domain-containing protein [Phycisphaerae bacterium]